VLSEEAIFLGGMLNATVSGFNAADSFEPIFYIFPKIRTVVVLVVLIFRASSVVVVTKKILKIFGDENLKETHGTMS
jgi:hypothetical protein